MPHILHITTAEEWSRAQTAGEVRAPSLEVEGFVHCSTREQLPATLARHFSKHRGLVVLVIDLERLIPACHWEQAHGMLFPHVFGPINLEAVTMVETILPAHGDS